MRTLARFVIRPTLRERQWGDLLLGALMKDQDFSLLRPDVVYEIRAVLDVLVIQPVGDAAIGLSGKTSRIPDVSWSASVDQILEVGAGRHLLTAVENDAWLRRI